MSETKFVKKMFKNVKNLTRTVVVGFLFYIVVGFLISVLNYECHCGF